MKKRKIKGFLKKKKIKGMSNGVVGKTKVLYSHL